MFQVREIRKQVTTKIVTGLNKVMNNRMTDNSLRELLVETTAVDKDRLGKVLKNFIRINSSDGRILLQEKFYELNIRNKVFAYMLGRKVAVMLGYECPEIVCKGEIKKETGILVGSLTPILVDLRGEELISRSRLDGYYISDSQAEYAMKELERASAKRNFDPRYYL